MSMVTVAVVGGSAVLGAGASLGGSMIQASATRKAAAAGMGQVDLAQQQLAQNMQLIQGLYGPYIAAGTNALDVLQSRLYSGAERQAATQAQRIALEQKIVKLKKPTDWNTFPILTGDMASERRQALFTQAESTRLNQLRSAKSELDTFNRTQTELAPVLAKQDAENASRMSRISTAVENVARLSDIPTSLAGIRDELQNDPVYQFRQEEGERAINRAAAQRGKFFSGSAIEELSDFSKQLTGEETDKYVNRRMLSLQAAVTGLGAELGEQGQSVGQALSLATLGENAVSGTSQATVQGSAVGSQLAQTDAQLAATGAGAQGQGLAQGLGQVSGMLGSLATIGLLTRGKTDVTNSNAQPQGTAAQRAWPTGGPSPY